MKVYVYRVNRKSCIDFYEIVKFIPSIHATIKVSNFDLVITTKVLEKIGKFPEKRPIILPDKDIVLLMERDMKLSRCNFDPLSKYRTNIETSTSSEMIKIISELGGDWFSTARQIIKDICNETGVIGKTL